MMISMISRFQIRSNLAPLCHRFFRRATNDDGGARRRSGERHDALLLRFPSAAVFLL
jgi:hypothetical protein